MTWERSWTPRVGESMLLPDDLDACVTHKRIYADGGMAVAIEFVVPWAELTVERLPDESARPRARRSSCRPDVRSYGCSRHTSTRSGHR